MVNVEEYEEPQHPKAKKGAAGVNGEALMNTFKNRQIMNNRACADG